MFRMVAKESSYWSVNPTMSKLARGRPESWLHSGIRCWRKRASASSQGAYTRSAKISGRAFRSWYRIFRPMCDIPIS